MCGIAGFISDKEDKGCLEKMTSVLNHRGPDAEGYFFDENRGLGLGHKRLKIIDLSDEANQPFSTADGRYLLNYNGEVYNYQNIRKELESGGTISFRTQSDTEVIAEAFAKWGPEALNRFHGMFAFTLYDLESEILYLARDRVGIKPLYYMIEGNSIYYSSELRSFYSLDRKFDINVKAVHNYLHLGFIPSELTILEGVNVLPPGCFAEFNKEEFKLYRYWSPQDAIMSRTITDGVFAKKKLHDLIERSVTDRLISDVPVGAFLSGGIDSSVVSLFASRNHPGTLKTFSIGFKDSKFDESRYAEKIAGHLKTDHYTHVLDEQDAMQKIAFLPAMYGQPFADSSAIPTLLVSELARKDVKVVLSGDGGDELFMGYGWYRWRKRLENPFFNVVKPALRAFLSAGNNSRNLRIAEVLRRPSGNKYTHLFSQEQYFFSDREVAEMTGGGTDTELRLDEDIARKLSGRETQALFDMNHYLPDDLLVKTDIASMNHSLELRVPLLDHRIVEFCLNLDMRLRYPGVHQSKYLLRQILYDHIPPEYFDRPKWGFSVPMTRWLKGDLAYLFDEYLNGDIVESMGFISIDDVLNIRDRFNRGHDYLYNRLWALIMLHAWYSSHAGSLNIK